MKKVSLILLAAALSATATLAQSATEPVYSQNAVGFINKTVEAGTYAALTFPFVDMAATNDLIDFDSQQIAKDTTRGSTVYFWNGTGWDMKTARNNGFNTGKILDPGEGFLYKTLATGASTNWVVTRPYDFPAAKDRKSVV